MGGESRGDRECEDQVLDEPASGKRALRASIGAHPWSHFTEGYKGPFKKGSKGED